MNTADLLRLDADVRSMGGWLAGHTITDADDGAVEIRSPGLDQDMYRQVGAILRKKGWQGVIVYAECVIVRSGKAAE
jgi:hypothetical protein